MNVVLMGARSEAVDALLNAGHRTTLLHEPWEEANVAPRRDRLAHACVVDSYLSVESLWSDLHHAGAISAGIDVIVSVGEYGVVPAAILGRLVGAQSLDPSVAHRCRDKALQKAAWRSAGIPIAQWVVLADAVAHPDSVRESVVAAKLEKPFIVKPISGTGTRNVSLAQDENELLAVVARQAVDDKSLRLMIEERIQGAEWHFDGIVTRGDLHTLLVSRYLSPLIDTKNGHPTATVSFQPARHEDLYDAARDITRRALSALGLNDGVFHFEVFAKDGTLDFVAGELAARPGGNWISKIVQKVTGVDIWAAATQVFTGDNIERAAPVSRSVFGYTHLPTLPGGVNRVISAEIEHLPGVTEVLLRIPYGEVMPDMRTSSATSLGLVMIEAPSVRECESAMARVVSKVMEVNG